MANSPQSEKRARQSEARFAVNKMRRSRIRTFLRKVEEAIASGNPADRREIFREAVFFLTTPLDTPRISSG